MTTKSDVLKSIRAKCIDCSGGSKSEVSLCPCNTCELWPYRFGRDPEPSRRRGFAKTRVYTSAFSQRGPFRHSPNLNKGIQETGV